MKIRLGGHVTFMHAQMLPQIIVTTEILVASWEWAFVRFLIRMNTPHMTLQVFAPSEALAASNRIAGIGSRIFVISVIALP